MKGAGQRLWERTYLQKITLIQAFITIISPGILFADDDAAQLQMFLCQTSEEVAAYVFLQQPYGTLSLIGESEASVSKSATALTVLLGDTVFQFQDNQLLTLANGTLQSSNCADGTNTIAELFHSFTIIEAEAELRFGDVVP